MTLRVNLACGQKKQDGWVGVDVAALPGVDVVHDLLRFPWPFADDSVDEVVCEHFIEHLPHEVVVPTPARPQDPPGGKTDGLIAFMNELHRILKPGGTARLVAPYYTSIRAAMDPTHTRPICEAMGLYYDANWRKSQGLDHYPITADFSYSFAYILNNDPPHHWASRPREVVEAAIKTYWNVVQDIEFRFVKRAPGAAA